MAPRRARLRHGARRATGGTRRRRQSDHGVDGRLRRRPRSNSRSTGRWRSGMSPPARSASSVRTAAEPRVRAGERPLAFARVARRSAAGARAASAAPGHRARGRRRRRRTPRRAGARRGAGAACRGRARRACRDRTGVDRPPARTIRSRRQAGLPSTADRASASVSASARSGPAARFCTNWKPKRPLMHRWPLVTEWSERRGDLHDRVVLHVQLELAADAAVGADRLGDGLLRLVPGARLRACRARS